MTLRDELHEKLADTDYLKKQYQDGSNFRTRQQIWERAGLGVREMQRWFFDRLALQQDAAVLELGSGPGDLWRENRDRIPPGWRITISDISAGMLDEARAALLESDSRFDYHVVDASAIPFEPCRFDAVIANLMLYHVPESARALAEIRRVLKPGGRFYATTFSTSIITEDGQIQPAPHSATAKFNLENGGPQIAPFFTQIEVERLIPPLLIQDPQLIAEMLFSVVQGIKDTAAIPKHVLLESIRKRIQEHPVTIRLEYGVFIVR